MTTYKCPQCRSVSELTESSFIFSKCPDCGVRSVRSDTPGGSPASSNFPPIPQLRQVLENSPDPSTRLEAVVNLVEYLRAGDHPEAANEILLTLMNDFSGEVVLGSAFLLTTLPVNRYQRFLLHLQDKYETSGERSTSDGAPLLRMAYVPALANDLESLERLLTLRSMSSNGMERVEKMRGMVAQSDFEHAVALAAWSEGLDRQFDARILTKHLPFWMAAKVSRGVEMARRGDYLATSTPNSSSAPASASGPVSQTQSVQKPATPAVLGEKMFQPFKLENGRITEASCPVQAHELTVDGGIYSVFFDYLRRMLLVQHQDKVIDRVSAWEFDSWRPVRAMWPFTAGSVEGHSLVGQLGSTLETSVSLVSSGDTPAGSWWHVSVHAPIRPFDFNQQSIHLIWKAETGRFVSAIAAKILGMPSFTAGRQHLALELGLGDRVLRVISTKGTPSQDFDGAPFSLDIKNRWPNVIFGPEDQYILLTESVRFDKEGNQLDAANISVYTPDSTTPILKRYFHWTGSTSTRWCFNPYLSARHELYGLVRESPESNEFFLVDFVALRLLADSLKSETKVKNLLAFFPERALIAWIREPNVLEVHQFGKSPSLVLRRDLDSEFGQADGSKVLAQFCSRGRYLLLQSADKSPIRIYTFDSTTTPLTLKSAPFSKLRSESVRVDAPPARPSPSTEPVTLARQPVRRGFLSRLFSGSMALAVLLAVYALSIGPVIRFFEGKQNSVLSQVYWPHSRLMLVPELKPWILKWCEWCKAPAESVAQILGDAPLQAEPLPPNALPNPTSTATAGASPTAATAASPETAPPPAGVAASEPANQTAKSSAVPEPSQLRVWTDVTGRKIEATLESWDGEYVELLTSAGKKGRVPVARLSPEDQEHLKGVARKPANLSSAPAAEAPRQ